MWGHIQKGKIKNKDVLNNEEVDLIMDKVKEVKLRCIVTNEKVGEVDDDELVLEKVEEDRRSTREMWLDNEK